MQAEEVGEPGIELQGPGEGGCGPVDRDQAGRGHETQKNELHGEHEDPQQDHSRGSVRIRIRAS